MKGRVMPKLTIIDRSGARRLIDAQPGRSLMKAICDAGLDELLAVCEGSCSCATCHVYVDEGRERLPALRAAENDVLESSAHRRDTSRLSCQIRVTETLGDLRVTIAPQD